MTDREALNQEPHQKAAMFSPSLTSKPSAQSGAESPNQSANSHGGASSYYQNVAQKGKLILPTAVWIIIVVAGLCFLGLLGSLNHTLKTLDTLVEIEQANAKHNRQTELNAKFNGDKTEPLAPAIPKADELRLSSSERDDSEDDPSAADSNQKLASWLSLPPWASLDPVDKARPLGSSGVKSLVDGLLQAVAPNAQDGLMPVGGSVIIASSGPSPNSERPHLGGQQGDLKLMDMIMQELMGELLDDDQRDDGAAENKLEQGDKSNNQGPLTLRIDKIDKINININAQPPEQSSNARDEWAVKSGANRRNEEMKALDKSIDGLMSKLMEPIRSQSPQPGPQSILLPLTGPIIRPVGPPFHQHRFDQQRAPLVPPFSPLAEFLMPIEPPKGSLAGSAEDMESQAPPMFGRPRPTPLIITLGADEPNVESPMFGSDRKVLGPNERIELTRRPMPIGSPYELTASDLMPKPLRKSPSDMSDHDLINSLAQSLFQATQENKLTPQASDDDDDDDDDTDDSENTGPGAEIVLLNGEPLIGDKKQSISMSDEDQLKNRNQVSDLFNLFFGSPPNSKLVVAPQVVEPSIEPVKKSPVFATTTVAPFSQAAASQNESELPASATTTHPSDRFSDQGERPLSTRSPSSSADADKSVEQFVNNILDSMLALPQFSNDQNNSPVRIDSSSTSAANRGGLEPFTILGPEYSIESIDEQ